MLRTLKSFALIHSEPSEHSPRGREDHPNRPTIHFVVHWIGGLVRVGQSILNHPLLEEPMSLPLDMKYNDAD